MSVMLGDILRAEGDVRQALIDDLKPDEAYHGTLLLAMGIFMGRMGRLISEGQEIDPVLREVYERLCDAYAALKGREADG